MFIVYSILYKKKNFSFLPKESLEGKTKINENRKEWMGGTGMRGTSLAILCYIQGGANVNL